MCIRNSLPAPQLSVALRTSHSKSCLIFPNAHDRVQAYRAKSLEMHPDKNPSPNAAEEFAKLQRMYEVLSNTALREEYDMFGEAVGHTCAPGTACTSCGCSRSLVRTSNDTATEYGPSSRYRSSYDTSSSSVQRLEYMTKGYKKPDGQDMVLGRIKQTFSAWAPVHLQCPFDFKIPSSPLLVEYV